jgi:hypothetical protein
MSRAMGSPSGPTALPRPVVVEAHEPVEDSFAIRGIDTRPAIGDRQESAVGCAFQGDADRVGGMAGPLEVVRIIDAKGDSRY